MNQKIRKLYLIPSLLSPGTGKRVLPVYVQEVLNTVDFYFVEEIRSARRFISEIGIDKKIESLIFYKVDKDTSRQEIKGYLKEVPEGKDVGILSEAGCPCIADPGSLLVSIAHEENWEVVPVVGPSSILLALIGSGFNGQNFAFHGYLPIDKDSRGKYIREMERESKAKNRTQIFMETPYRNNKLLEDLLEICNPETLLCLAVNISSDKEMIKTRKVREWKKSIPDLNKQPAIFLLFAV